jgi:RNA polymerase sigma-70 factor (ECF subfamily)
VSDDVQNDSRATDVFTELRPLLFTVAYEMLGVAADADDVLQDSWLRWAEVDLDVVRDPKAYLVRVVTRQALNRMRTVQRRRESYVGPWLPEPLLTVPDVAEDVELAESVSIAMLVVLDSLSPLERAVFVLREVFGFEYDEVADAIDRTPAAVRQLAHRAREHVRARRPGAVTGDEASTVSAAFFAAVATGELQELMDLLAPDAVLLTDGGGKKQSARRPVVGADKIARFLLGIRATNADFDAAWLTVNGAPAVLVSLEGEPDSVFCARVHEGRVVELFVMRNPEKLAGLGAARSLSRA